MKANCFTLRPGTIFGYKNEAWKILTNDTLNRRFQARRIEPNTHATIKTWSYQPGQEIDIRWKPDERRERD